MSKALVITVVNETPILDWTGYTAEEVKQTLDSFTKTLYDLEDTDLAALNESETSLEELINILKNLPNIENETGPSGLAMTKTK